MRNEAPLILSQCGMKLPLFRVNVKWSSSHFESTGIKLPSFWVNAEKSFPHSESTRNEAPLILSQRGMKPPPPLLWVNAEWNSPHSVSCGMKLPSFWINAEGSYPQSESTQNQSEWNSVVAEATWNVFLWFWHKFKYSDGWQTHRVKLSSSIMAPKRFEFCKKNLSINTHAGVLGLSKLS